MEFKVDTFSGPLDLLLHLIKENKMDIFDIEVSSITKQYLEYLHNMKQKKLEIASSYLVLASELIELKAKMLLPSSKKKEEEEEEEDPRNDLVERLLEYQAYQEISKTLKEKEEMRKEVYTKLPEKLDSYKEGKKITVKDGSLDALVDAFKKFLERKQEDKPLSTKITTKELSVSSRTLEIRSLLKEKKKVSFFHLFPVRTKEYIVVTFLAILERAKNKELKIEQDGLFHEIICHNLG